MNLLGGIVTAQRQAMSEGKPAVLATVMRVEGSAYRRPGARMLFCEGRPPLGMVSGGCLEADLAERVNGVMDSGKPALAVYDMRSPDDLIWGMGMGCNGEVRVLLERLMPDRLPPELEFAERELAALRSSAIVTLFAGDGAEAGQIGQRAWGSVEEDFHSELAAGALREWMVEQARATLGRRRSRVVSHRIDGAGFEALAEFIEPDPTLLLFGAGSDAIPLVRIAGELGWHVTLADDRPSQLGLPAFADVDCLCTLDYGALAETMPRLHRYSPAIVMTHHFLHDLDLLEQLHDSEVPYIGLLGPRMRAENLLCGVEERGRMPHEERRSRIFGPVGIDIGSETPEEIALAALAEIRAVLSSRHGGFLRDRTGSLHEW